MTNLLEESTRTGKFGLAVALGPPCPTGSAAVTARPVASSMCLGRVPQARKGFRSNKSRRPGEMVGTGSQYCLRLRTQRPFDGNKTHRLHLPPNSPAKNFWSLVHR